MENEIELKSIDAELADLKKRKAKAESLIIAPLQTRIRTLEQKRAELLCPFKVGDLFVNLKNEHARLDEIRPDDGKKGFRLVGIYLKADGTPWKNPGHDNTRARSCSFNDWEQWTLAPKGA